MSRRNKTEIAPRKPLAAAIALSLTALFALPVHAEPEAADVGEPSHQAAGEGQSSRKNRRDRQLSEITVQETAPQQLNSPKYQKPLLDTPQSVNVVTTEQIEGQNLLGLRDILSTLPGITFGAGEGGGGYGDSINLRGFSANNDIMVDGVRDSAQYTRTDPFNLDQLELINGANSVYAGAGSIGGSINLVSKRAINEEFMHFTGGAGTDGYGRATADINQNFGAGNAFRVNLMRHRNDVPGRDIEENDRWGFAPSVAFGLDGDTQVTLSYIHQDDQNTPQYGVPFYNGAPIAGVDPSMYFGYSNIDTQEIINDAFTAVIDHTFGNGVSVRNLTRQGETDQLSIVNPPQGTYCLTSGINPATGAACTAPGTYQPSGPRGNLRDTTNSIFTNQTDFVARLDTGAITHNAVIGFSFTDEDYELSTGNVLRNPNGSVVTLPRTDLFDPDHIYTGPVNYIEASRQEGQVDNKAIYAFDSIGFGDHWIVDAGVRYESNNTEHRTDTVALPSAGGAVTPGTTFHNDDDLVSYRAGITYKPTEASSIYASFGDSNTPSKASVNGACTAQTCNVDPEEARVYEIGAKWDLFKGKLQLTGALFRNDRHNYKVADPGNPDNPSGEQQLDGRAKVDGLILGVNGQVAENWNVYANYTHLKSEVIQGASDFVSGTGADYTRGDRLLNTPENAVSAWTTWDATRQWQFGYGLTYQGQVWLTQHSATNIDGPLVTAAGYTVHRAMAAYRISADMGVQLNVNNLLDKEYYVRPRNNGWSTPGEARAVVLSFTYDL